MVRLLDFTKAQIVVNNLGGKGPNKLLPSGEAAPEEIRFRNLVQSQPVDLVVTTKPGYEPFHADRNGILGGNGQINARSGSSVPLTFSFVKEGTNIPHVMKKFYFTFSDLDERHGGKETEKIRVTGFDKYYTTDDLHIVEDGDTIPTFASSDSGNYTDNDFSPDSPSPTQLSHAVTYLFTEKSQFEALYSIDVEGGRKINKGRNVLFSGISQLAFCQEKSIYLDFKKSTVTVNNLGGKGPEYDKPKELRFAEVANDTDGNLLDVVLTAAEPYGYVPYNTSNNGMWGDFAQVNLFCGQTKKDSAMFVTFTIVKTGTNDKVELPAFALAFFDFDTGASEQQTEYIEIKKNGVGFQGGTGYASYIVTPTTEIEIGEGNKGRTRFAATKHGTLADNPTSAQNMARETADKTVVFTFRKTSSFQVFMAITPTGFDTGRNFMFSGQDMYLMCD
jgi:hypothetical protein